MNLRNCNGETVLALASRNGQEEWVTTLLEKGAHVNKANKNGETPLINACGRGIDKAAIVEILLKAGADVNASTNTGKLSGMFNAYST